MENNCNIISEGEQLLIHLVRLTTKEEKITQYDMNTHKTVPMEIAHKLFECV